MKHGSADPACLEIFARLSAYIDGELGEADCAEIEAHIADCPPCIDFLRGLRASVDATRGCVRSEAPRTIPPELNEKLRNAWQAALARKH
jgi:anti-sigma factor (TIGR02949 family)